LKVIGEPLSPLIVSIFDFYVEFMKYMTYEIPQLRKKILIKGLRINTMGKSVKWLKAFLKNRLARLNSLTEEAIKWLKKPGPNMDGS